MPLNIEIIHSTCYTVFIKGDKDTPLLYLSTILNIADPTGSETPWTCQKIINLTTKSIFVFSCLPKKEEQLQEQPKPARKSKCLRWIRKRLLEEALA